MDLGTILILLGLIVSAVVSYKIGHSKGFKFGQKDEQVFFGIILSRLARRENTPDLMDKVAREYNITMMELVQKVKDLREGRQS